MMGLAEFYMARPDSNIYNFINTQLLSVVFNDLDPTWLAGELWGGPWNVTTAGYAISSDFSSRREIEHIFSCNIEQT